MIEAGLLSLALAVATGSVAMEPLAASPVAGKETTLTFADDGEAVAGAEVVVVYRENAHERLRYEEQVGKTSIAGTVAWTPQQAGVVVVKCGGASQNLTVVYDGTPMSGVIVAILAGLLLIGGSLRLFVAMLREDEITADDELHRPDT